MSHYLPPIKNTESYRRIVFMLLDLFEAFERPHKEFCNHLTAVHAELRYWVACNVMQPGLKGHDYRMKDGRIAKNWCYYKHESDAQVTLEVIQELSAYANTLWELGSERYSFQEMDECVYEHNGCITLGPKFNLEHPDNAPNWAGIQNRYPSKVRGFETLNA